MANIKLVPDARPLPKSLKVFRPCPILFTTVHWIRNINASFVLYIHIDIVNMTGAMYIHSITILSVNHIWIGQEYWKKNLLTEIWYLHCNRTTYWMNKFLDAKINFILFILNDDLNEISSSYKYINLSGLITCHCDIGGVKNIVNSN